MRDLMVQIFGTYEPIRSAVYDQLGNYVDYTVVPGAAGVDWTYIGGIVLFAIVLYSFFRLLGVVLRHG